MGDANDANYQNIRPVKPLNSFHPENGFYFPQRWLRSDAATAGGVTGHPDQI